MALRASHLSLTYGDFKLLQATQNSWLMPVVLISAKQRL